MKTEQQVRAEEHKKGVEDLAGLMKGLDEEFDLWLPHYRDLATFVLPRQYAWLSGVGKQKLTAAAARYNKILLATATDSLRTLSHGLMNGITSPALPWFRLGLGFKEKDTLSYPHAHQRWIQEATNRMYKVLAQSNFYSAMSVKYTDLSLFGTAAMLVYEDYESVVRFYNSPVGEFRLMQSSRRDIDGMTRKFGMTLRQLVQEYGLEKLPTQLRADYKDSSKHSVNHVVCHAILPNRQDDRFFSLPRRFAMKEVYWLEGHKEKLLRFAGFMENPISATRWEVTGNDTYGTSPAHDALSDIKQLQVEVHTRLTAIAKLADPPMMFDQGAMVQPNSFLPGGRLPIPSNSSVGAKALYTATPPVDAINETIAMLVDTIRRMFYNHLFRNISNLDTVRSATEVAERKSEDLIMLGSVLNRFETEALDPIIMRVFHIMFRKELFPPLPEGLDLSMIEIHYVSILSDAQRSMDTGNIERFLASVGELAAVAPEVLAVTDFSELLRIYAEKLNIPALGLRTKEEANEKLAAEQEQTEAREGALVGKDLTQAAQNLSQTDVGGGVNAMEQLLQ